MSEVTQNAQVILKDLTHNITLDKVNIGNL